ncbi:chemotaxis protein CheW [Microvirga zambiensis]|uniref:chemotaxis protein CheW n=1 Tax=Microvirga zambiensis TaxID=1402137 RepID=UPI00191C9281|nr:chemotaxis protein CheW [Microvirga zambiensis]
MAKSVRRKLHQMAQFRVRSAEERRRQILDDRTANLAARKDASAPAEAPARALVCGSGRERFGIPVEVVAEILPAQKCVPVPDAAPALIGLFGRGGRLVSVIDLAVALGLEPAAADDGDQHFVLLRREQPQVALRVERAYAVSEILPLAGEEAAGFRNDAVTGYARPAAGMSDQEETLSLLDTERLLRPFLPSSPVPGV